METWPSTMAMAFSPSVLTSADGSGWSETFDTFRLGDLITLSTSCTDYSLSSAQWAGGVGGSSVPARYPAE